MTDENRNQPPVPPAPPANHAPVPPAFPPAPSAQPAAPASQPAWQQSGPQQGWQQPAAPQQGWQQPATPQSPAPQQQAWQQQAAAQQGAAFPGWQQQAPQQNWQQGAPQPGQTAGQAPTWDQLKASGNYRVPPEYPADRFNPESFSVPAFFFSWIWYMVKGMWQKGLVFVGAVFVVAMVNGNLGSLVGLGMAIYAGMFGHRDYMRYYNSKKQFWF